MENCTGVHINLSGGEIEAHGTLQVVKAAQTLTNRKIRRISLISGVSTTCKENSWYEGTRAKRQAETYLIDSGFDYSIFRCTMFLETLPKFLLGDQTTKWHWLAAKDYARMVSKSFTTPKAANKVFFLYGPAPSYTLKEAVDDFFVPICDPTRPPIPTVSMDELNTTTNLEYSNMSEKAIAKFQWLGKIHELGNPTEVNDLLGAPTISLEDWCRAYSEENQEPSIS
jgi:uncharacterized protein YbjT (DUF2867 family)